MTRRMRSALLAVAGLLLVAAGASPAAAQDEISVLRNAQPAEQRPGSEPPGVKPPAAGPDATAGKPSGGGAPRGAESDLPPAFQGDDPPPMPGSAAPKPPTAGSRVASKPARSAPHTDPGEDIHFDDSFFLGPPGACDVCGGSHQGRRLWVEADYLLWWADGMFVPPLVTTGNNVSELMLPNTTILFGNQDILDSDRHGGRIRLGGSTWCPGIGYEAEYFGLPQTSVFFSASSNNQGLPFLGRPFFNINPLQADQVTPDPPPREDAQLVSGTRTNPNETLIGTVSVEATSSLIGAAMRMRWELSDRCGLACGPACGDHCDVHNYGTQITLLTGYRYLRLTEGLIIREDLSRTDPLPVTDFDIFDRFDTRNQFHGAEVGMQWLTNYRSWSMALTGKIALGDIQQSVLIDGDTSGSTGGLLAQTSNIGHHRRHVFGVVPELNVRLSKRVTRHISTSLGYTFLYWSRVARPGDQIDLDVNPELLPPPNNPINGPLRPRFVFRDSDYWVQGLTAGITIDW